MPEIAFLTQQEAAEYLRLSPRTMERHRVLGSGPRFCRLGRRIVYRRADLDEWADAHSFESTAQADVA